MTLNESKPTKKYQIIELSQQNQDDPRIIRLKQFGFIPGGSVTCKQLSPWLKNPILLEIRGVRVALTKEEASLVKVKEVEV